MARYTKTIQFIFLSVLLHLAIICGLISVQPPASKEKVKKQPIQTYLVFEPPKAEFKPVEPDKVILPEVSDPETQDTDISAQKNERQKTVIQELPDPATTQEKKPTSTTTVIVKPKGSIKQSVSQYIQQLHVSELEKLSESALGDFRQPKPLIDKSKTPTTNQGLRAASESFAPKGADIVVLSEFGPGEKTVLLGDACARIVETALDDKVWNGALLWVPTNACGKYDKFDGQLQKSLDKYLKK